MFRLFLLLKTILTYLFPKNITISDQHNNSPYQNYLTLYTLHIFLLNYHSSFFPLSAWFSPVCRCNRSPIDAAFFWRADKQGSPILPYWWRRIPPGSVRSVHASPPYPGKYIPPWGFGKYCPGKPSIPESWLFPFLFRNRLNQPYAALGNIIYRQPVFQPAVLVRFQIPAGARQIVQGQRRAENAAAHLIIG